MEQSLLDLGADLRRRTQARRLRYQVPRAGRARYLLRIGRARPTPTSPAWGAARDLPRAACPHLDARGVETRTETLVPNGFSDYNALLAQMQMVWALMHNAIAGTLAETRTRAKPSSRPAASTAASTATRSATTCGHLAEARLRDRYTGATPAGSAEGLRAPREFMAGVGRLGHGWCAKSTR